MPYKLYEPQYRYSLPRWRFMYWLLCDGGLPESIQKRLLSGPSIQSAAMWSGTLTTLAMTGIALYRAPDPWFWLWFVVNLGLSAYRAWLHSRAKHQWRHKSGVTPTDQIYLASLMWSLSTGLGTALCLLSGDAVLQVLAIPSMVAMATATASFSHGTPRYAVLQILLLDLPLKLAVPFQPEPWFWIFVVQAPFFWGALYLMVHALNDTSTQALLGEYQSRRMARLDPLTELLNRDAWFREALAIRSAGREALPVSLLYADLDGFKGINDTYGHQAGDDLLRYIANEMRHALRHEDILSRWGGDEFLILLPGANPETSRLIAQRMIDAIGTLRPQYPDLGLSVGIVQCDNWRGTDRERLEALIAQADHALYQAKQNGKGCFQEISA
ncbi:MULTISPECIES: GGDEF domain-containing protein [Halomonadaceae]|uniref:GGDEF domain-containing protein n=1 Tax=Halomonadaceae TaxID=28256 RepID=UPI001C2EDC03|nr:MULTISPECIES: GGDEF domain-containing protein [Halomonas]MDI4638553.1 GGDEF domain-containing protein [Halomonas sp. BMC7]NUJ59539.1 GGDEF domain-containing protein [Halomonas taeanensis]